MPNPFPVPGKPFSIQFGEAQGDELPPRDVQGCIRKAYKILDKHIKRDGDGPLPQHPTPLQVQYGTVWFGLGPATRPPLPVLSYSDAIEILRAFSIKVGREGYRYEFGRIVNTEVETHLGDALLFQG